MTEYVVIDVSIRLLQRQCEPATVLLRAKGQEYTVPRLTTDGKVHRVVLHTGGVT